MTPARIASRLAATAPLLLALAGCGDGPGGSGSAPLGFELAFAASGGAAAGDDPAPQAPAPVPLSPEALAAKVKAGNIRLIDVRTDEEVAQGVIPGAEHIALDRFDPATLDLSDGREVVLYCRSGRRSAVAAEKLSAATGKPAEHLAGGLLAWEAAGLPVERKP